MEIADAFETAVAAIGSHRLRSFLIALGIAMGVAAVLDAVAVTAGLDRYIVGRVLDLGADELRVQKVPSAVTSRAEWQAMNRRKDIGWTELDSVTRRCTACSDVGASVTVSGNVRRGAAVRKNVPISGITANFNRVGAVRDLAGGRELGPADIGIGSGRPVVVIGSDVAGTLFLERSAIGEPILVDGRSYTVIGVLESKGAVFGQSQDDLIWMPITTFQKAYGSRSSLTIRAQARSAGQLDEAHDQARIALRLARGLRPHEPDDFAIEEGQALVELWRTASFGLYVVTVCVTAVSLIVSAVVMMNMMLVSVTERTREIGIRRAVGARREDIRLQFMIEAVMLWLAGGGLGILAALALSPTLSSILGEMAGAEFTVSVPSWAVATVLSVSAGLGLSIGLYPARRAATLDPVAAMRSET